MKNVLKLALAMVACFCECTKNQLLEVSGALYLTVLKQGVPLSLQLPGWLAGWLARELQGAFCLYSPSAQLRPHTHAPGWLFTWVLGIELRSLLLVQ